MTIGQKKKILGLKGLAELGQFGAQKQMVSQKSLSRQIFLRSILDLKMSNKVGKTFLTALVSTLPHKLQFKRKAS